ncbi:MAG: hypothetical protein KDB21_10880 [Acidimicrobiales bacterium]|nr:hypothetical protein [Acidimicrobiales bacterium]
MRIGVVYPQTELNGDTTAVLGVGRAIEELGFDGVVFYDHVLGADQAISGLQSVRRHLDAAGRPGEGFGAEMLIGSAAHIDQMERARHALLGEFG